MSPLVLFLNGFDMAKLSHEMRQILREQNIELLEVDPKGLASGKGLLMEKSELDALRASIMQEGRGSLTRAQDLLDEAQRTINGPRQKEYGHPRVNFQRIADIWNIHLGSRFLVGERIVPRDVAIMMIGLKVAREAQGPKHDTLVDLIGYAALAEEVE